MDLPYLIRRAAGSFPHSPAVEDAVRARSLSEVVDNAERFANALDRLDVPEMGTVGVLSENRAEYIEADIGIGLARRVRLALNAKLHLEDHRYVSADADLRVLVHSGQFEDVATSLSEEFGLVAINFDDPRQGSASLSYQGLLSETPPTRVLRVGDVEDPAWITYTSGTTGRPKGIVLSHRAIREVAFNLLLELGPVRPGEQITLTQALSHGSGYFVLPYLLSGGGVYILSQFDPEEAMAASRRPNVKTLKLVPAMLPPLLELADPGSGYSSIVYGASPMPQAVLEAALDRFGPVLLQVYGQSEAPVTLACLHKDDHVLGAAQSFSAGRPWRSVSVEVRDGSGEPVETGEIGEVTMKGSHMMTRYHRLPEATAEVLVDGWLRTRDMGRFDERGFLYLLGRTDEMINSGGFNVAPREVEFVLSDHPAVEEVVVVGIPDERWGTAISAVVRVRNGAQLESQELIDFARPRLGFRCPKQVTFVEAIPKTPYGKVARHAVLEALELDGRT